MRDSTAPRPVDPREVERLLVEPARIGLVVQPIADLKRGVVVGYETLARFAMDTPAAPDRVFAAAIALGLGEELEARVVRAALALADDKPANCFVTLNIDPRHFASPLVQAALDERPSLTGLVLELTEHSSIEDLADVRATAARLRGRGALIALDDAGAGYSGLRQILELSPQFLKLDRALVTDVHTNEAKRALIQMLGELAGRLDAWLIAEGIENEADLATLRQLGVPLGQGFFLARPAPPWSGLSPLAAGVLTEEEPSVDDRSTGILSLERCARVNGEDAWPAAAVAVRTATDGRPVELRVEVEVEVEGQGRAVVRAMPDLMLVKLDTSLSALALRAMTRPERLRWDPLVYVDDRGRLLGVLTIPRLVGALAAGAPEPRPRPATAATGDMLH